MHKTSVIHARIEPSEKSMAERILRRLGLSSTEAIRMFYRQIVLRHGLPFSVEIPKTLTRATLISSTKRKKVKEHGSIEELVESWRK
jgi:DNA-damage-inducible protein J